MRAFLIDAVAPSMAAIATAGAIFGAVAGPAAMVSPPMMMYAGAIIAALAFAGAIIALDARAARR